MRITYFLIALGAVLTTGMLVTDCGDSLVTTTYTNVKIESKHQQNLIKGKDALETEIRYLIITDKGTFICESNFWKGKFNNSDLFWHLKEGTVYSSITVTGYGKGFFFDYQNLIHVE